MTDWPTILRQLIKESGMSQRAVCAQADVCRTSFNRILNGVAYRGGAIIIIERVLAVLGYELEIMLSNDQCQSARPMSAVVEKSSRLASAANAARPATETAKPDTIKSGPQPVSGDTPASGSKSARPSSPAIPDASCAENPRPSLITSSRIVATAPCSGADRTGSLYALPATAAGSNRRNDNSAADFQIACEGAA